MLIWVFKRNLNHFLSSQEFYSFYKQRKRALNILFTAAEYQDKNQAAAS